MKFIIYISTVFLSLISTTTSAQTFTSNKSHVNLIELYTSEGCSSCPPADEWLNKLKYDPRLWSEFIPVAFHVDYWDYIGWKDPFATPEFGLRQRQYSQQNNLSSVYTPGMLLNGHEWTSWRRQTILQYPAGKFAGILDVNLNDGAINASYHPLTKQKSEFILNVAVVGFDLKVDIKSGENKGRKLTHDFVVLGYKTITMNLSNDGLYTVSDVALPKRTANPSTTALVTWVNNIDNLSPIQATGGWINQVSD